MSNPPVLRLSEALYTDMKTTRRARPIPSSRCKRALEPSSSTQTASTDGRCPCYSAIRVLLPTSFAVADRAYHAAARGRVASNSSRDQQGETELTCPCHLDTPLLGHDISTENNCSLETPSYYGGDCDNGDEAEAFSDKGYSNHLEQKDCGLTQDGVAVRGRSQEHIFALASETIVVESVLGFLAVRALLEQAHQDSAGRKSGRDASVVADASSLRNDDTEATNSSKFVTRDSSRQATSVVVRRLVEWLRFAPLIKALRENEETTLTDLGLFNAVVTCPQLACSRGMGRTAAPARPRRKRDEGPHLGPATGDDEEKFILSSSMTDVDAYEVTGRCEAGMEWTVFHLELQDTTDGQGRPLASIEKTYGRAPHRWHVLEVKLICHPLVTMAPDIRWCLRLIGQAKVIASLLNANAKLSTLGGGYFLTRQVGQAIHLARAQAQVATALGDLQLARKCQINEAYNYIWLGEYAQARRIIHAQLTAARTVHDEELETIAGIAAKFLGRAKKANRRLLGSKGRGAAGDINHVLRADATAVGPGGWARPQIDVKTDEWHRVRALPLYCSGGIPDR